MWKSVLFAFVAAGAALAAEPTVPNLYLCSGDGVSVRYMTSSISGKPMLTLSESDRSYFYVGTEHIDTSRTTLGTLATVVKRSVPDLKTETATLILPYINLRSEKEVSFSTVLVDTTTHTSIAGPALVEGVVNPSTYTPVECKASKVVFSRAD